LNFWLSPNQVEFVDGRELMTSPARDREIPAGYLKVETLDGWPQHATPRPGTSPMLQRFAFGLKRKEAVFVRIAQATAGLSDRAMSQNGFSEMIRQEFSRRGAT
jgi:hypothetical protein